jgi:hypothetical protein
MRSFTLFVTVLNIACIGGLLMTGDISQAAPVPPGIGLGEAREKRLAEATGKILQSLASKDPDYVKLSADIAAAREDANALAALAGKTEPAAVDEPEPPEGQVLAVPEGSSEAEVRDRWKEQLLLRIRSVNEMLTGTEGPLPLWGEVISVSWYQRKDRTRRARPAATALREAHAFASLLAATMKTVPLAKGDVLFEDDFSAGTDNWYLYGPAETTKTDDGLRRRNTKPRNADTMLWTKKEFDGDFLFEFSFLPHNGGKGPGALFAVCGRPVKKGDDLSVSCGETMETYNYGINAYHFSLHRGVTGICNGRRVGTGLHLIGSRTPDPAREEGRTYRVAIGKWKNTLFLLVDGKLQHSYVDTGTFGPPLDGGSVGMRHWGGLDATYGDVRIYRLTEKQSLTHNQGEERSR